MTKYYPYNNTEKMVEAKLTFSPFEKVLAKLNKN